VERRSEYAGIEDDSQLVDALLEEWALAQPIYGPMLLN